MTPPSMRPARAGAFWRRALLAAALATMAGPAAAQTVDYGMLEQIFGEPITTSATGKPQRASDVPADMTILTQDDIRRSGADNIPDILQFVPGLDIQRYSFDDAEIAVRGYDQSANPRLLVMIDGRQVYSDDYGYVPWSSLPVQLSDIRQIEVVRGPNTALFGFNAASGVINIVTYDPLLDNTNSATVRGGTQGYGQAEAVITQHIGRTAGVRVSLGGRTSTGYPQPDPVSTPTSRYGSADVDGRWQVTSKLKLSASGGYTNANAEANLGLSNQTQDRLSYGRLGASLQTGLGVLNIDAYRNHGLNNYGRLGYSANTVGVVKISHILQADADDVVRTALEYRHNGDTGLGLGGTVSYDVYAASGMWNRRVSNAVDLTDAVRLDHLQLHYAGMLLEVPGRTPQAFKARFSAVSFNAGLVIRVTDQDTIRLLASRGLQLPSLIDFGLQRNFFGLIALGSPSLQPVAVWNAELAYDRALPWLGATMRSTLFFQRNTDLIDPAGFTAVRLIDGRPTSIAANAGSSTEIGPEIGLRGTTAGGLRWNASYRYNAITDHFSHSVVPPGASAIFQNGTPRNEGIVGLGYTNQPWEMDVQARAQTGFTDYTGVLAQRVPAYVSFNARVGYRITDRVTVAGTAEQFNAAHALEAVGSYIDRRFIVSLAVKE